MIDLIKYKKIPLFISSVLAIVSLVLLFTTGLKPGIDFTGGSLVEVSFTGERPTVQAVQDSLSKSDLNLGDVVVQPSEEHNMLMRMRFVSEDEHQKILEQLRMSFEIKGEDATSTVQTQEIGGSEATKIQLVGVVTTDAKTAEVTSKDSEGEPVKTSLVLEERIETIGPAISSQLRDRALWAMIVVVVAIVLYIAYAFRKVSKPVQSWKYGIAAVIALIHDVLIVVGVFVVLGKVANVEVGIPFIAALLTVFGYSVNDTIVVFDRIRENLIKRSSERFGEMVNMGVNQTLMRSFNTSLTTLIVLFAMFFFGGESIKFFSLALIIGITSGTYSSIFLASPLLVIWEEWKKRE